MTWGAEGKKRDLIALILVEVGLILWVIGWLVGLFLLWTSPRWRTKDKVLATVLYPGGMLVGAFIAVLPLYMAGWRSRPDSEGYRCWPTAPQTPVCKLFGNRFWPWPVGILVALIFIGIPIVVTVHMIRSHRDGHDESSEGQPFMYGSTTELGADPAE